MKGEAWKAYYAANREKILANSRAKKRAWSPERKAAAAAKLKAWRVAHPDAWREYRKRYQAKKPEVVAAGKRRWFDNNREKSRQSSLAHIRKMRADVIAAYGGACTCCGESEPDFLSIDHINNDGAAHRKAINGGLYHWLKANGYPRDNFRLQCMNCNWSRGKYGSCPHERRLQAVK